MGTNNFDLVIWPWSLTYFLTKNKFNFAKKNFWKWAQELLCFTWVFIETEPFYEIQDLWPWTLESGFLFVYFNLVYNIWIVSARALTLTFDQIFGKKTMVIFFKKINKKCFRNIYAPLVQSTNYYLHVQGMDTTPASSLVLFKWRDQKILSRQYSGLRIMVWPWPLNM